MADLSTLIVTIESEALAEAIDLREKVKRLEAEVAALAPDAKAYQNLERLWPIFRDAGNSPQELAATIDTLTQERDEARAWLDEVAFLLKTPPAFLGGINGWAEVKMAELGAARAEVERLRPAAEAWGALPEDVQIDAEVAREARALAGEGQ